MDMGLTDKIILITGAASGIGLAIARAVAIEGVAGLILTDRDANGLANTGLAMTGLDVLNVTADLTDSDTPEMLLTAARNHFGRLDGLINAAGLTTRASLTSGTTEIWDQLFNVNAKAAYFLMQAAARDMLTRSSPGTIVNILSVNAHCGAPDSPYTQAQKVSWRP